MFLLAVVAWSFFNADVPRVFGVISSLGAATLSVILVVLPRRMRG